MNEDLISDIIKECTKYFKDIKKRQNVELNKCIDNITNELDSLKDNVINQNTESIESNLLSITNYFIEVATQIVYLKYSKFYFNILILLKKFIEYNIFSKEKGSSVIRLIKELYNNSKINDECQNKILEILQTFIFSSLLEIKYETLSTIYIIILKSFNNKNQKDFKNPIRLLLSNITEKIYKSNDSEVIVQITILIFSWYKLSLKKSSGNRNTQENNLDIKSNSNEYTEDIDDKLKEEIIVILNQKKNNVFIQCLSLELLSQILIIIHSNQQDDKKDQFDINFLNGFIKEKVLKALCISLDNIIKNNSTYEDELNYLHFLKLCRLLKIIIFNCNINYDLIKTFLDIMIDKQNKNIWKLNLSIELIFSIITNYNLLQKINKSNQDLLISIFTSIKEFINNIESLKDDKESRKRDNIISSFMKKKELDNDKIYIERDEIIVFKEHSKKFYKSLINDCLHNIIDSLKKDNKLDNNKKEEKDFVEQKIFDIICDNIKGIIFQLFSNEMNKRTKININAENEIDCDLKIYINYVQDMMELYNNLNIFDKRDEYLQYLCEMANSFPEDNNNDEKNIYILLSLINLSKSNNIFNKNSLVIILQTIEKFNHIYNISKLNEYINNDLDKIIKDINNYFFEYNKTSKDRNIKKEENIIEDKKEDNLKNEDVKENADDKKDLDKKDNNKKEDYKVELRKKLCETINTLFLDSKNMDLITLKCIIDALSKCIDISINNNAINLNKKNDINNKDGKEKEKESKNNNINKDNNTTLNKNYEDDKIFNCEIIFYFSKILTLTILNVDNIFVLFEPLISVINKLVDKKIMIDFSIDILCTLIPEILLKYEKIELNIKRNLNEDNKIWVDDRWQKILFSPFLTLLSQPELYKLIKGKIFLGLNKIIQQSGHFIDMFGWESIMHSCNILANYDIENTFLSVKQILNDYNIYLSLFNIIPLMKLLQIFIFDEKNTNISISAIELFWSCADLIDDIKQGKKLVTDKQKILFNSLLKDKEIKVYCDELYYKLFSYLIGISKDSRVDVKKSGINIFTDIFVSKMKNINYDILLKILNDIFFKVFSSNTEKFISDKNNQEFEQTLEISLLDMIKILKELFLQNIGDNKIFENYLNKIIEIIPKGSVSLISDIIKSILDIKINKNEKKLKLYDKLDIYFKILKLTNEFIKGPNFTISKFNKEPAYNLFNNILSFLIYILWDNNNIEELNDEHFKNVFDILNSLFEFIYSIEPKLIEIKPRNLTNLEKDIFLLLENIPVIKTIILNYLIEKMAIDIKNPHSEVICNRSIESFQIIICKTEEEHKFGLRKEENEIIKNFIKKIKDIFDLRNKNEIIECLINTTLDKNNM
jgi:hypothetical protein